MRGLVYGLVVAAGSCLARALRCCGCCLAVGALGFAAFLGIIAVVTGHLG